MQFMFRVKLFEVAVGEARRVEGFQMAGGSEREREGLK
jgi:hypothetical protein